MSAALDKAVEALSAKLADADLGGMVKFEIDGEGAVMVDGSQTPPSIQAGDGDADVTIGADAGVFEEMLAGDLDPTSAYMSGRLRIDGDMGMAMRLAQLLA